MAMGEITKEHQNSLAAPIIFMIITLFRFLNGWVEHMKKRGSRTTEEVQLRREIKQIIKEASALSQPSTFAQAAKLRRMAAAKEKELLKIQASQGTDKKSSFDSLAKVLFVVKVLTYFVLICWFWRIPVAAVSKQLVQPFGRVLSWRAGAPLNDNIMVGIIPWLILSNRVSKYICRLFM